MQFPNLLIILGGFNSVNGRDRIMYLKLPFIKREACPACYVKRIRSNPSQKPHVGAKSMLGFIGNNGDEAADKSFPAYIGNWNIDIFVSLSVEIPFISLLIDCPHHSGPFANTKAANRIEGDFSCTLEVERAIPILQKAYGDSMHKVLHVGPDTCSVVSRLLREEDSEAFGVEPYDIEDADRTCRSLVHRGLVRVADIKFPLPYRAKSFSLVIVSDALDYLSPKYLNRTLPELARVSSDGLVVFTGQVMVIEYYFWFR
ncbi:Uncharacterized protein SHERM_11286 [Striga hermonthica]|uniref:Uncharacterized protein n=1 Tax=Striga hermonthica TaxID=68872 RepID=A0A9N7R3B3_STRHE|nr:Uncharacterized protein SHERM_11286 [Striga hermonthica]